MNKHKLLFTLILLLTATAAWSATLIVAQDGSGQYTEVQPAFDACANNDTVLIVAGNYGDATISNKEHVVVMGAGFNTPATTLLQLNVTNCSFCEFWSMKIIRSDNSSTLIVTNGTNNTFRRCWFNSSGNSLERVVILQDSVNNTVFLDDIFEGTGYYYYLEQLHLAGTGLIDGCLFKGGTSTSVVTNSVGTGQWVMSNCTFVALYNYSNYAAVSGTGQIDVRNCILWNTYFNTAWPYLQADYNASNNGLPGDHNVLLTASPFVNEGAGDFHLAEGSPCWDVGDPGIHDRYARGHDSTLSDLGCYGGMAPMIDAGLPPQTAITSLSVTPVVTVGDSILIRATGVGAPRY